MSVYSFLSALASYESNNGLYGANYYAVSPTGAVGAYQFTGPFIRDYAPGIFGYTPTKQELLNNPAMQDQLAYYAASQLYDRYGSWNDVASRWLGVARDPTTGVTNEQYTNAVISRMNQAPWSGQGPFWPQAVAPSNPLPTTGTEAPAENGGAPGYNGGFDVGPYSPAGTIPSMTGFQKILADMGYQPAAETAPEAPQAPGTVDPNVYSYESAGGYGPYAPPYQAFNIPGSSSAPAPVAPAPAPVAPAPAPSPADTGVRTGVYDGQTYTYAVPGGPQSATGYPGPAAAPEAAPAAPETAPAAPETAPDTTTQDGGYQSNLPGIVAGQQGYNPLAGVLKPGDYTTQTGPAASPPASTPGNQPAPATSPPAPVSPPGGGPRPQTAQPQAPGGGALPQKPQTAQPQAPGGGGGGGGGGQQQQPQAPGQDGGGGGGGGGGTPIEITNAPQVGEKSAEAIKKAGEQVKTAGEDVQKGLDTTAQSINQASSQLQKTTEELNKATGQVTASFEQNIPDWLIRLMIAVVGFIVLWAAFHMVGREKTAAA